MKNFCNMGISNRGLSRRHFKKCVSINSPLTHSDHHRVWLEVKKLEYSLRLKIKRNDWLLVDKCPQAANHCTLF